MSLQITRKACLTKKFKFRIQMKVRFLFICFVILEKNGDNTTDVVIEIDMELNFMMKMLVQKPINIFLEKFAQIIKNI